jgi:hypothetical protein
MRLLFALLSLLPLQAMASADCPVYPKEEWASEVTLKTALNDVMKSTVIIKRGKKSKSISILKPLPSSKRK